jgi:hypothetical protein
MSIIYENFEIESTSEQLPGTKKWTTSVNVIKNYGSHVITKKFDSDDTYNTKKEADKYSIAFGQQIIDGKHKGLSVGNM